MLKTDLTIHDVVIPPNPIDVGEDGNGRFAFIYRGEKIKEVEKMVNRKNVCLKIFKEEVTSELKDFWWGFTDQRGTLLLEANHVQNIFAHHDLAPRVYKVIKVNIKGKFYFARIIDDLGHFDESLTDIDHGIFYKSKIVPLAQKYGIIPFDDGVQYNIIDGKYVDFQGFRLSENYEQQLKKRIEGIASKGKWGPWQNYHDVLGLSHGRDTQHRIEKLGLDKIDFKGKSVLDIGCSEGVFCHYAESRGASKIIGIDLPEVTEHLWELSSYLGSYNADYYGDDLKKDVPDLGQFDIVLYLSMGTHIGLPDWVLKSVKETLIYEGNSRDCDEFQIKRISEKMNITYENYTEDLFKRKIIWAQMK